MFARPRDAAKRVTIVVDGAPLEARAGESVAAALLAGGRLATRTTPATGAARGPWCLMGACFDCLAVIDGEPSRQACLVVVREGMTVETQRGARALGDADEA
jgi:predicted molibdopterin-dependent oxidoreductase YjgC